MNLTARQINKKEQGFTLIELLVVIGILAVLMGIVLVAINPARQFNQANDAKRGNDIRQILNAIGAYSADNKGALPSGITTSVQDIKTGGADLCTALVPTYISALPEDPSILNGAAITDCSSYDSGYSVIQDSAGRVTISASHSAITSDLSVTR